MKILVTGSNGQLGTELHNSLEQSLPGITTYVDKAELNLTDRSAVEAFLRKGEFTHIINCAAYTAVDLAEEQKLECAAVNTDAVANIARLADELGYKIIHISSDYVFDGRSYRPYNESDKVNPLSLYGTTKRKGETVLFGLAPDSIVIRTGWMHSPHGSNFVKSVMSTDRPDKTLRVVCDRIGTPSYATDLANAIITILTHHQWVPGIVNYSNEGVASRYDVAMAILRIIGRKDIKVVPVPTSEYPTPAERPLYTVLDKSKFRATYGIDIPHWEESLAACIDRINSKTNE